jgi:Zn-dependent protease with chaperone function
MEYGIRSLRGGIIVALVLVSATAIARADTERDQFERGVVEELTAIDPTAVSLLEQAEAARLGEQTELARERYARLLDRVPGFVHAQRRLCSVESSLGNHDRAIALCREAVAQSESPENLTALAAALARIRSYTEAQELAGRATQADPSSPYAYGVLCGIAIELNDLPGLERCSDRLLDLAPDDMPTQLYAAIVAASYEQWSSAREHLDRAHDLGLPDDVYAEISASIDDAEPMWPKVLEAAGIAVAGWLVLMFLLIVVGGILSRLTLRAATRVTKTDARQPVHAAGATLRAAYRNVLRLSCAVYYASLPLLLAIILITGGGLIYAFFAAGRVPIKGVLFIGIITAVSAFAVIKSLFVRGDDSDPGTRLNLAEHPRLRVLLDEVAGKIGTRPVDSVYLTPGTDIAVLERGGVYRQLRGDSERCLILGLGVLEEMPVPAFKAILAHEYGHFSNEDTAGGGLALAVRRSLMTMGVGLAQSGSADWYNPAWLFFRVFYRVFQGISQGASRLQEIMADRWAVLSYGARNFEAGLRHAIRRSIMFDKHIGNTLDEVIESEARLSNLYSYTPKQSIAPDEVDDAVNAAIERKPSPYDSHPSPADRFTWAHAIGAPEPDDTSAGADAWTLLDNREQLERHMTQHVRENVAINYGIAIAGDPGRPHRQ